MRYPEAAPHHLGPFGVVVLYVRTRLGSRHAAVPNDKCADIRVRQRSAPPAETGVSFQFYKFYRIDIMAAHLSEVKLSEVREVLRCVWILEIFGGAETIAPPEHRVICTISWEI